MPPYRPAAALTAAVTVFATPAAAHAALMGPPGPWPTPITAAPNPLTGTAYTANGSWATPTAKPRLWWTQGRRNHTARLVPVGRVVRVSGQLRNRERNRAISGATVQIVTQPAAGGDWTLTATTRTNRRGRFTARIPAGLTRRVAALYWPTNTAPTPTYSRRLQLRATARLWFSARSIGRRVIWRGTVSGDPRTGEAGPTIPPAGLLVAVQVRNSTGRWVTARLTRAAPDGRWFVEDRLPRGRWTARAYLPAQATWDLYGGYSAIQIFRTTRR